MASADDLPDAILTDSGLKITPLDAAVPQEAQYLIDLSRSINGRASPGTSPISKPARQLRTVHLC
jgi:hypothetical protein